MRTSRAVDAAGSAAHRALGYTAKGALSREGAEAVVGTTRRLSEQVTSELSLER